MPNSPRKYCSYLAIAFIATGLAATRVHAKPKELCHIATPKSIRVTAGEKAEFYLGLVPVEGFAVSTTGPLRISLVPSPGSGLVPKRSELRRKHAKDPTSAAPRFPLVVQSSDAGAFTIQASARFWLCKSLLCRPQTLEAVFSVLVEEPEPLTSTPPDSM